MKYTLLSIFLIACTVYTAPPEVNGCDDDVKLCFDGSTVRRSGAQCIFEQCPPVNPIVLNHTCESEDVRDACPTDYNPVCGAITDGSAREFTNGCAACNSEDVIGYNSGLCTQRTNTTCSQEVQQCPDGSFVSRVAPSCEFAPCPTEVIELCNYDDPNLAYLLTSEDQCELALFRCPQGKAFFNECGCGCDLSFTRCTEESREAQVCSAAYIPVCSEYSNGETQTYANSCVACMNSQIVGYKAGEC